MAPAADVAAATVERMKELGVLLSTDGPHHNVIKIKPPLCFTREDADTVVEGLEEAW
jgi:4-aminobutyrate aminotransferase-like enzyme